MTGLGRNRWAVVGCLLGSGWPSNGAEAPRHRRAAEATRSGGFGSALFGGLTLEPVEFAGAMDRGLLRVGNGVGNLVDNARSMEFGTARRLIGDPSY